MAIRQIAAGVIIYRKTKEGFKFLILYHGKNYWNFPKGKIEYVNSASLSAVADKGNIDTHARIEKKETSFQTALREVKEETGLSREDLKFNDRFKAYENFSFFLKGTERTKILKTVIFYLAEAKKTQIKIPEKPGVHEQYEGYGWFTYREALKILSIHKDSRRVLKQAYDFLQGRKKSAIQNNQIKI